MDMKQKGQTGLFREIIGHSLRKACDNHRSHGERHDKVETPADRSRSRPGEVQFVHDDVMPPEADDSLHLLTRLA
jgi:hypothetical protein